jgi:hypothetical protein
MRAIQFGVSIRTEKERAGERGVRAVGQNRDNSSGQWSLGKCRLDKCRADKLAGAANLIGAP